jgi:diaminopimelate decarboxylase
MIENLYSELERIETPFYLYDIVEIDRNIKQLKEKFSDFADIYYAMKANSSVAILSEIRKRHLRVEIVSSGELYICIQAGFKPEEIMYNNIARKESETEYAIQEGVSLFNFESLDQALLIENQAKKFRKKVKLLARVNPAIFSKTHPHLSTGSPRSKFGLQLSDLKMVLNIIKNFNYAELKGLHCHIGSQILSPFPFIKATTKISYIIEYLRKNKINIEYLNLGGGFGIPYRPEDSPIDLSIVSDRYREISRQYGVRVILEPGRFIVGNAGYLISSIISIKKRNGMSVYVLDAGMAENPRPAIYGAYHHIEPIANMDSERRKVRVVGSLCENADEFGIYNLPFMEIGNMVLIYNCGAYTRTMASNYNGRLLPAEYMLNGDSLYLVRKRQDFENLINNEVYSIR